MEIQTPKEIEKYSKRLFVGGLSSAITEEDVSNYFSQFGELSKTIIMRNMDTGASKCYGFIEYEDQDASDQILGKVHVIKGREIDVNFAFKKSQKTTEIWRNELNKKKVFITGLRGRINKDDLKVYFKKFGDIRKTYLIDEPSDDQPRYSKLDYKDYGYVEFFDEEAVEKVLKSKKNLFIKGLKLSCYRFKFKDDMNPKNKDSANEKDPKQETEKKTRPFLKVRHLMKDRRERIFQILRDTAVETSGDTLSQEAEEMVLLFDYFQGSLNYRMNTSSRRRGQFNTWEVIQSHHGLPISLIGQSGPYFTSPTGNYSF